MKKLQNLLTPFALAFFISYLLDPLVDRIESLKVNRTWAVIFVFILFSLVLFLIFLFLMPVLVSEINHLAAKLPEWFSLFIKKIESSSFYKNYSRYLNEITPYVSSNFGKISNLLFKFLNMLKNSLGSLVNWILLYSIVPILVFYFLKDFDFIVYKIKKVLEVKGYTLFIEKGGEFNIILKSYFRGQFFVSVLLAIMYSVVLLLVGVDGALLVGISAGILSMVPYLGFVFGFLTSIILAAIQFQDFLHPIMVVLGFTVVQLIESNFLTPKIVGENLGLHPVVVIFALMAGGYLFGIAGMIFSLPVAAFFKIILNEYFFEAERK